MQFKSRKFRLRKNPVFAKSVSLSPDGSKIAIHLLNTNRDSVIVLGEKGEEIFSFDLDTIYPHKLNLAISNTGEILVSTPNSIEFYNVSGKKF